MEPIHLTVQERLDFESYRRGANGAISQAILAVGACFFMGSFSGDFAYRAIAGLLVLLQMIRVFSFQKYKDRPDKLFNQFPGSMYWGVITGVFWSALSLIVHFNFPLASSASQFHLILISSMMSANMYSMASVPGLQRMYLLAAGIPTALLITLGESDKMRVIGVILFLFTIYLTRASKNHSSDLYKMYDLENKLRKQNQKLQEVVNSVPGFVILFSKTGEWIQISETANRVKDNLQLKNEIHSFLQSPARSITKECELKLNDISQVFVMTFEKLSSNEAGSILVGLPIGELVNTRKQLEQQKAIADYSAKLASLGEVAGGVAHEINNPLAIVKLVVEVMEQKILDLGPIGEGLKPYNLRLKDSAQRIAKIVEGLLTLTQRPNDEFVGRVLLNEVLDQSLTLVRHQLAEKRIELQCQVDSGILVLAHQVQLGQVFLNLIRNSISAVETTEEKRIQILVRTFDQKVEVLISDTGIGIPISFKDKLFQPFQTFKPIGEGAGLGLSISRAFMQKAGGDLVIESLSSPTTFKLTLKKIESAKVLRTA